MTDKLGRVDYTYDTWSRLKTETRKFDDISGPTFQLSYNYNLAGEITSLTDPFGGVVNYAYNDAGQLRRINSGAIAEGMTYRAWGAIKHADYGNGTKMSMDYNRRMSVTDYQILLGPTLKMGNHYTHDDDNKVSFARDLAITNSAYDRSYSYDHTGRLTEGKTGAEARGTSSATAPYRHTYGYDVWDNLTTRGGKEWGANDQLRSDLHERQELSMAI